MLRESQLGADHPHVATSLNNLAEPLYQRALQICEQSLGIVHPNTMTIRANYAQCLKQWSFRSRYRNNTDAP
jgi:hypothetical protein